MKRKILTILLTISISINIGFGLTVGYHWWKMSKGRGSLFMRNRTPESFLRKQLKLSPEQAKQFDDNHEKMRMELSSLREKMKEKHKKLFVFVRDDKASEAEINKRLTEITNFQLKIEKLVVNNSIELRKTLTPEQCKIMDQLIEKKFNNRKGSPKFHEK